MYLLMVCFIAVSVIQNSVCFPESSHYQSGEVGKDSVL